VLGLLAVVAVVALAIWLGTRDDEPAASEQPTSTPSPTPTQTESPSKTTQTPTETGTPTETETPEPTTVEVDPADYIGRKVKDVEKELAELGLVPERVELENPGDQEKDLVTDVSPSGTLEEGSTVTITYYGKPPRGNGPGSGDGEDDEE
jgi:serine/threonine-protein kinase